MNRLLPSLALVLVPVGFALAAPAPQETGPVYSRYDPSRFLQEPTATVRSGAADADVAKAVADALNQDAELQHAKITVGPEKDSVLLTGVTLTNAQRQKAGDIASQNANGLAIVNALQTEELVISQDPTGMTGEGVPQAQGNGQSTATQQPRG